MSQMWRADPAASFVRRLGKSAQELGATSGNGNCPATWGLGDGDIAIIGQDVTASCPTRLPEGVGIDRSGRLVVIPQAMSVAARQDTPDA